jgi:5-methyltetrahydrofolate--homocysteine methyltransferase
MRGVSDTRVAETRERGRIVTRLLDLISERGILLSDGAWGTELTKRGLGAGECPEAWNLERPDDVRAVAAAYVEAGSDIILTNSFGGSRVKLAKAGLADRVHDLNVAAARLSKEAAEGRALVFASVGPTGELLSPLGDLTEAQAGEAFEEQIAALAEGGADGIVIETFLDLREAQCALAAARRVGGLPVVVSMTFERGPRGLATVFGVTPTQAATRLTEAGADSVGANCGAGMEIMIEAVREMRPLTALPLWAKSNAGLPRLEGGQTVFDETPEAMAARLPDLVRAGADIIGGCCGATPAHIAAFAARREELASIRMGL